MKRLPPRERLTIARAFGKGETIAELAYDHDLDAHQVEDAIRCVLRGLWGLRPLPWRKP